MVTALTNSTIKRKATITPPSITSIISIMLHAAINAVENSEKPCDLQEVQLNEVREDETIHLPVPRLCQSLIKLQKSAIFVLYFSHLWPDSMWGPFWCFLLRKSLIRTFDTERYIQMDLFFAEWQWFRRLPAGSRHGRSGWKCNLPAASGRSQLSVDVNFTVKSIQASKKKIC